MNYHNCYVNESGTEKCPTNILFTELAHNDIETDVIESNIISQSGLPKSEVQILL